MVDFAWFRTQTHFPSNMHQPRHIQRMRGEPGELFNLSLRYAGMEESSNNQQT